MNGIKFFLNHKFAKIFYQLASGVSFRKSGGRDFFRVHTVFLLTNCNVLLHAGDVSVDLSGDFCVLGA